MPRSDDARFELLNAWLRRCDLSHDCKKHETALDHQLPSRFLEIDETDPSILRLIRASQLEERRYVALSHRWGSLSLDEKMIYCTTKDNIVERSKRFSISQLPTTFQDAVRVAREIGVRYLWIDSLCIIQYGDNGEDWQREFGRMESVFSEAYCTISAVAATDSKFGFLNRTTNTEYTDILVEDSAGKKFHVSNDIDDYDRDVGGSEINKRAWVTQEAILSRRIIHFTANQMYWECGEGVQCENLTALTAPTSRNRFFVLDPNFPSRVFQAGPQRTIRCLNFLFEDYTKRNLTVPTDRCVAISGLVDRIERATRCPQRYGVFQKYLHKGLLWQACDNMAEIEYDHYVPSWSWMACSGSVRFMFIVPHRIEWIDHLKFDEEHECNHAMISHLWAFKNDVVVSPETDAPHVVTDANGMDVGSIKYDTRGTKDLRKEYCVVVARDIDKYYILVVESTNVENEYRRVGAGLIQCHCVVGLKEDIRIV